MATTLYRFFDKDDVLLYVGVTQQAWWRWQTHRASTNWWTSTHHVTLEHFEYREQALAAEKHAIKTERPVFNRMHRSGDVVITEVDRCYTADEIAEAFRASHIKGKVRRGALLPTIAEMAEQFRTSRQAVKKAMQILRSEGLIYGGVGQQWIIWGEDQPVRVREDHPA